jgi:lipoate---protein ligase
MEKNWRLIPFKEETGAKQMAIDEAMLIARSQNIVPNTLRFFSWKPSAITIGFFQNLEEEINIQIAKKEKIDIIRRYTGGGAVFHQDELTYSLVVAEKDLNLNIADSYKYLCNGVILGLKKLGLEAEFKPINDILVNNKKISGNAQTRKKGVILQHGTILLSVDLEKMFSLLKIPNEKLKGKLISSAKERVTSLKQELNSQLLDLNYLQTVFSSGFSQALTINLKEEKLTKEEEEKIEKLYKNKYLSYEWNYQQKYKEN